MAKSEYFLLIKKNGVVYETTLSAVTSQYIKGLAQTNTHTLSYTHTHTHIHTSHPDPWEDIMDENIEVVIDLIYVANDNKSFKERRKREYDLKTCYIETRMICISFET